MFSKIETKEGVLTLLGGTLLNIFSVVFLLIISLVYLCCLSFRLKDVSK